MSGFLHIAPPVDAGASPVARSIRVVLADDHALMRRSLRFLLDGQGDVEVVAEAVDLASVVHLVVRHLPHVLVLDLGMPNGSSIEVIGRLREQVPRTGIVVVTMEDSPAFAQQALDAGAIGFAFKDFAATELPEAVRSAARGEEHLSPGLAAQLESMSYSMTDNDLTVRETEVLRIIALGHTSAEIGDRIGLSRRTVETYRARLYGKLGLSTRAGLVDYALRRGLLATCPIDEV